MKIQEQIKRFERAFRGCITSYGTYKVNPGPAGQKLDGVASTQKDLVTSSQWEDHILGEIGLGICPLDAKDNCRWGCIDFDKYDCDHIKLVKKFKDLPFIICRSKSGGAHIFLFMTPPVPARLLKNKLAQIASELGLANQEIFPKQSEVLTNQGDRGNWVNLPYFDQENTTRYAFDDEGNKLPLSGFLDLVDKRIVNQKELEALTAINPAEELKGGPPCLQCIIQQGGLDSFRNNGLFNFGVYAKKAFENDWREKLEGYNRKHMNPPLAATEMAHIIKELDKKNYGYKCKDQPIAPYCNSGLCRTRQYGIGAYGAGLSLTSLAKFDTSPPTWFLEVEDKRMELETEELQIQAKFQKKCIETLNKFPPTMKPQQWQQIVSALLEQVTIIDAPASGSSGAYLKEILFGFLSVDRNPGRMKNELLIGKPWLEEDTDLIYFRLMDFMNHLQRLRFFDMKRHNIAAKLREFGCKHKVLRISSVTVNVFFVEAETTKPVSITPPLIKRDPI